MRQFARQRKVMSVTGRIGHMHPPPTARPHLHLQPPAHAEHAAEGGLHPRAHDAAPLDARPPALAPLHLVRQQRVRPQHRHSLGEVLRRARRTEDRRMPRRRAARRAPPRQTAPQLAHLKGRHVSTKETTRRVSYCPPRPLIGRHHLLRLLSSRVRLVLWCPPWPAPAPTAIRPLRDTPPSSPGQRS